jgi:nucleotide-binding universal stress UspA family protein
MRILLAVDDSKFSEAAVQAVVERATPEDTEVQVLHVVEPPSLWASSRTPGYDPAFDAEWWRAEKEQAHALVEKTAQQLRSKGLKVTAAVEEGETKSRILEIARSWAADLIVLGSHGRKGLSHFLMGSVSDAVVRHASCSVEIVRVPSMRQRN